MCSSPPARPPAALHCTFLLTALLSVMLLCFLPPCSSHFDIRFRLNDARGLFPPYGCEPQYVPPFPITALPIPESLLHTTSTVVRAAPIGPASSGHMAPRHAGTPPIGFPCLPQSMTASKRAMLLTPHVAPPATAAQQEEAGARVSSPRKGGAWGGGREQPLPAAPQRAAQEPHPGDTYSSSVPSRRSCKTSLALKVP